MKQAPTRNDQPFQMQSPEVSGCQAREILRTRLRADLRIYSDAVAALQKQIGKEFEMAHHQAERARLAYEAARERLNEHIASHGCA
jgi:hypothetical protein